MQPQTSPTSDQVNRFVAFDISKLSLVVAAVDAKQQVVLQPKKISVEKFTSWASQNLKATDQVVLEVTGNAWQYYDQLVPLVHSVVVANPSKVKLIAQTKVKTDATDALALAHLLAADLVPAVWVPPPDVRELRALVSHRIRLVRQRTQARNRLHALLATHHLLPPAGDPFSEKNRSWWEQLKVTPLTKLLITQEWLVLQSLKPLIEQAEKELVQLSIAPKWSEQTTFLIQVPGIGVITAMVILSAIGEITRFSTAKELVGYSGLGAGVYASGQVMRSGAITKQGRRELRTAMVEAAWIAVEQAGYWKEQFERLAVRLGKNKAIVAIARRMLVVVWNLLSKQVADNQADEARVARKLVCTVLRLHHWVYLRLYQVSIRNR